MDSLFVFPSPPSPPSPIILFNKDLMNFDTIGYAFLIVFQITTLEGWTDMEIAL